MTSLFELGEIYEFDTSIGKVVSIVHDYKVDYSGALLFVSLDSGVTLNGRNVVTWRKKDDRK
jgi:hypothetical protein